MNLSRDAEKDRAKAGPFESPTLNTTGEKTMSAISETVASLRAMADDLEAKDRKFMAKIDLGGVSLAEAGRELRSRIGKFCTINVEIGLHDDREAIKWTVYDSSAPSGSNFIEGRTLAEAVKACLEAAAKRAEPDTVDTVADVNALLEPLPL
jgi:hypothetical protein